MKTIILVCGKKKLFFVHLHKKIFYPNSIFFWNRRVLSFSAVIQKKCFIYSLVYTQAPIWPRNLYIYTNMADDINISFKKVILVNGYPNQKNQNQLSLERLSDKTVNWKYINICKYIYIWLSSSIRFICCFASIIL